MASGTMKVIGGKKNFWLYSKSDGFDLTPPETPGDSVYLRLPLVSTKEPIAIDPSKSALVVVDMQNYFLSPRIRRPSDSVALKAMNQLLQHAIPACRKAGTSIVWLNWGLTEQDIEGMPPTIIKASKADLNFDKPKGVEAFGRELGPVTLEDGSVIDGGRVLMRDQWNSALYGPLDDQKRPGDIWIHRNRHSSFWRDTGIEECLTSRGIRTLLFAGANLDQCVGMSLQDAMTKGWDILLLKDGCTTTSPDFARQCIEYNTEVGWGFILSCEALAKGVMNIRNTSDKER